MVNKDQVKTNQEEADTHNGEKRMKTEWRMGPDKHSQHKMKYKQETLNHGKRNIQN